MFINRVGAQFQCEGVTYTIGGKVCANDASDYEGLYGTITEIRDSDDRETENDTPDIDCSFMPPVLADDIEAIESRFSQLYRREMHLEDIGLDIVIMAPDMLKVLEPIPSWQKLTIYIVREEWAFGGDYGEDFSLITTPDMAKYILTELVTEQLESGYASEWPDRPDWGVECTPQSYECGLHDSYCENHYKVCIEQQELPIDDAAVRSLLDNQLRRYFAEQIEGWDGLEGLTEQQITDMIAAPNVPQHIRRQLEQDGFLMDSFWESVSKASSDLVRQYKEKLV